MPFDVSTLLYTASIWVLPAVTAITLHEAAHGWMAWKLGDDTARRAGRLSFNPARHIDPFGTIILPAMLLLMRVPFLFGYAKPVPVDIAACAGRGATWSGSRRPAPAPISSWPTPPPSSCTRPS